jgi:uncharacterized membrane protein YheB (UPF0754 family)
MTSLFALAPPGAAAAILQLIIATAHGFLGAWLAVKMVFRPLKPVFIFGWRVPFTPGMIPAERASFFERFASVIADRVLTVETMADEIVNLGIKSEMDAVSAKHYAEHTASDDFLANLAKRLTGILEDERNAETIGRRAGEKLSAAVMAEVGEKYGFVGKMITHRLIETGIVKKILTLALEDIANQLSRNPLSRKAMIETITVVGHQMFAAAEVRESTATEPSVTAVDEFVRSLSRRLNIERILREQLERFTDEMIEDLIYRIAGRELRMIIRFGAVVGFGVGVVQAGLTLLSGR